LQDNAFGADLIEDVGIGHILKLRAGCLRAVSASPDDTRVGEGESQLWRAKQEARQRRRVIEFRGVKRYLVNEIVQGLFVLPALRRFSGQFGVPGVRVGLVTFPNPCDLVVKRDQVEQVLRQARNAATAQIQVAI